MKVWMIVVPVLVVLAVGGAIAAYFIVAPPTLADDYEEKAEPEHTKVEDAVIGVTDTFNADVFGTDELSRKLEPREYLRRYKKISKRDRARRARVRREIREAKRALAEVDADAMTEAPSWPLLGGDLDEAERVAEMEAAYMDRVRRFLSDYEELVEYDTFMLGVYDRVNIAEGEANLKIPKVVSSPGQVTGPLGRVLRVEQAEVKRLQRRKPPKPLRAEHRKAIAVMRGYLADERDYLAAVRARDIARVDRITKRIDRRFKADDKASRKELQRLIYRSTYTRQIDDLEKREDRITKAYEEL